jgi:hypothetical protein
MDLNETSGATIMLHMKQDGDEGKTPVVIEEQKTRPMDMSAALALRHSGLPYYPVREGAERPAPRTVRLELPPNGGGTGIERTQEIPATLTFLDENGEPEEDGEPVRFQAKFAADADNVMEMSIIHTGDLEMEEDELADLLFDAYRDGSIDEAEARGWDSLQHQLEQLRNTMGHAAAAVLRGPEQAMEDRMKQHLASFDERPVCWRNQPLEAMVRLEGGTLRMSFEPDPAWPQ